MLKYTRRPISSSHKVISQQAYEYSSNKIYAGLYVFNLCNEIGYKEAYF